MSGCYREPPSSLSLYLRDINEQVLLTKPQEQPVAVATEERGGAASDEALVRSHLGFVIKLASEYKNLGLPLEDLINEGNLGLMRAVRSFDNRRGIQFTTYAVWWIRKSILRALSFHSSSVRVPEYQRKRIRRVREAERALSQKLGRRAQRDEISKALRLTIARIDQILQSKMQELSLDDEVGKDRDRRLADLLVDERAPDPEREVIRGQSEALLQAALRRLSDQEQTVLINRFGLGGGATFSLKEIGDSFGLSRERIRQIESVAMKRLRKRLAKQAWVCKTNGRSGKLPRGRDAQQPKTRKPT